MPQTSIQTSTATPAGPDTPVTDAVVEPTAFLDRDLHEGDYGSDSVRAVLINRPRDALYAYWRDFRNLPTFMETLNEVRVSDTRQSTWIVEGPGGGDVELTSEITEDRAGEYIAWRAAEGSDIDHEGWIGFRDNAFGRGTEVRLFISYDPPAGVVGKVVAKVLQREPRIQARRELRRFKQLMETGEVSTSRAPDAAPRGPRHL
ncbi:SRPBCC family protein [Brevundimonas sp. S30B]|uniref:SRPBCC family protein n=1 Tax=unclassified Brevundimonas TaxID=2622653 RepID=UPI001072B9DD|nr:MULTISPECIES: SRPBCC family protein [unclassified Brevundimonas]QBX38107.1 SRPBCC family protein [Brevundimonas sp. MF30-B]TFW02538.1 SRPBCC family protein [Brevundimonas sp. S30B]